MLSSKLYSNIASLPELCANQYNLLFFSSAIVPTVFHPPPTIFSILVLPNIFCTVPTPACSEVEICIFIASLYCPLGTILSSRS